MNSVTITIDGMHCDGCVRRAAAALNGMPGTVLEDVRIGSARLRFDPASTAPQDLIRALEKLGFDARVAEPPAGVTP